MKTESRVSITFDIEDHISGIDTDMSGRVYTANLHALWQALQDCRTSMKENLGSERIDGVL